MSKKLILSLSIIGLVAAIVVGGTIAYFSDTETSTGNTFTAGAIDLKIDSECHYYQNGEDVGCDWGESNWELTDLEDGVHKFFAFSDLKPGDYGEDTISLHVYNNDAWGCVTLGPLTNNDNGCNEPEDKVDGTCGDPGEGEGELGDNLYFRIWADVCHRLGSPGIEPGPAHRGDNIYQPDCDILLTEGPANGDPLEGVTWTLADSSGNVFDGEGPLVGSNDYYLGVGWYVPSEVGNIIQTDSVSGDISFYIEQARNNPNFRCVQPEIITVESAMLNFSSTGWGGWSCPISHPNVVGGSTDCEKSLAISQMAKAGVGTYPVYPHYTYTSPEEGWVVQNGGIGQSCKIYVQCQAD